MLPPLSLLASNPSFQTPSSAANGGVAEVDVGKTVTTGSFNFGGSSMNMMYLALAGVVMFWLIKKR